MMEKKTYVKPTVETVAIETNVLMAASLEQDLDKHKEPENVIFESKRHSFNVFDDDEEYE